MTSESEQTTPPTSTRRAFVLGSVAGSAMVVAGLTACSTGEESPGRASPGGPRASTTQPASPTSAGASANPSPAPARFVSHGPADVRQVALTFHTNGDVALAHRLLDVLDARGVPVTAFVVGNWLEQHPDWAARLVDAGHELANHTYSHRTFARLAGADMAAEVTRCRDLLDAAPGTHARLFRPSGTANGTDRPSDAVLAAAGNAGYATVLGYDVDPADYRDPGSSAVVQRVVAGLHPGAIVSMHFGHAGTIDAIPAILDAIEHDGLQPVTASRLIS
jgi:peptidoglycan/xylan/chitin deacetylase (PgdA/CDA1 family)